MGKLYECEVRKRLDYYIREYGLYRTHKRIKCHYKFYPKLRAMMLRLLYANYGFYNFGEREEDL